MRDKIRIWFFSFVFCLLSFFAAGCGKPLHKDSEFLMGTFVEVVSNDPKAKDIVFSEFKRLEGIFNLFDNNSELYRLNASGALAASPELFEILKNAKYFYEETKGAFDVTIAPLSLKWKSAIKYQEVPKDDEIKKLMGLVGFDYVYLDENTRTVRLLKSGGSIDLGGIAKGYAVDRAIAGLRQAKIASAIVNAGGNLYCLGDNNGASWQVGIQDPRQEKHLLTRMAVKDKGVSSSGDYEQFFIYKNKRYSHIIDPRTGYPADSGIIAATVVANDALTADALSTSLIILGKDRSSELLKRFPGASAKLIDASGRIFDI
ncbi:MAG: FAD:protein FMN transferase [Candidatus Omnitrophota bacterium]